MSLNDARRLVNSSVVAHSYWLTTRNKTERCSCALVGEFGPEVKTSLLSSPGSVFTGLTAGDSGISFHQVCGCDALYGQAGNQEMFSNDQSNFSSNCFDHGSIV